VVVDELGGGDVDGGAVCTALCGVAAGGSGTSAVGAAGGAPTAAEGAGARVRAGGGAASCGAEGVGDVVGDVAEGAAAAGGNHRGDVAGGGPLWPAVITRITTTSMSAP
jgi:hypothetical protein